MRSLQSQMSWCSKAHWTMSLTLTGVVTLFFVFVFRPVNQRLGDLRAQIESRKGQLSTNQSRTENLKILALEVSRLKARLEGFNKRMPKKSDLVEFTRELGQVSQQSSLRKLTQTPGAIRRQELYTEQPIAISFEGDFIGAFNFLRSIEDMQRLTRVRSLQIRARDGKLGQVDVTLSMNIYAAEL